MSVKHSLYLQILHAVSAIWTAIWAAIWAAARTLTWSIALLAVPGFLLAQTSDAIDDAINEGEISRAQFTTLVTEREPVDSLTTTDTAIGKLYFFTEVKNMTGKVFFHRWRYFDELVAEIPFTIKGPRWRVNSYKNFTASMSGEWSVELVDDKGNHYGEHSILVAASGQSADNRSSPGRTTSAINRIKKLFPDADYTLADDAPDNKLCPPSGFFQWIKGDKQRWSLDMGTDQPYIRIFNASEDSVALQAEPALPGPDSSCEIYAAHNFNAGNAELVTEIQADCDSERDDIFSASLLRRQDDLVELTVYAEQLLVCRYRLN